MGKIIYHRDIEDQVIILDKEFDYSYYRESLIYCITNSRNKTEWMQVIHIGYRNRKPLYLFNDVKERYIAARRLGIDIGFYEITGTGSKHLINIDTYYLTVLNKIIPYKRSEHNDKTKNNHRAEPINRGDIDVKRLMPRLRTTAIQCSRAKGQFQE